MEALLMTKFGLRRTITGIVISIVAAVGLPLATASAASASTIPSAPQSCSSGQPKLDYEYEYDTVSGPVYTWSNVCGIETWTWDSTYYAIVALRMPTSPYHRIWFHENPNGSGLTACFYSQDMDLYMGNYTSRYGSWIYTPGNVQVSANTAGC